MQALSVAHALRLRPVFLLYSELFSNRGLFTDRELRDAITLKNFTTYLTQLCCCTPCDTHTACGSLCSLFFYCTVNSFPTVNSLPTMNCDARKLMMGS